MHLCNVHYSRLFTDFLYKTTSELLHKKDILTNLVVYTGVVL